MTTLIAAGPPLSLSAPLPAPRRFTLLDAAQSVAPTNDRWLTGAQIEDYPSGRVGIHDACDTGTSRVKEPAQPIPVAAARTFTAYLLGECGAQFVGPDPQHLTDRLRNAFEAKESTAVERALVNGGGHDLGASLGDDNVEILASGTAQGSREALALLEQAIAEVGTGIIHATPATAIHWAAEFLIAPKGGVMYTALGTPVAVGAGYIGAEPSGGSAPGVDKDWAFASGLVSILRSDFVSYPQDYAQALDRSLNEVVYLAEREYLLNWVGRQDASDPDHIQAAVLVDRTPA